MNGLYSKNNNIFPFHKKRGKNVNENTDAITKTNFTFWGFSIFINSYKKYTANGITALNLVEAIKPIVRPTNRVLLLREI